MRFGGDEVSADAFGVAGVPSLPFQSTPWRQAEHEIRAALAARSRIAVLSGLDGVGKSTLAWTLGARLAEEGWRVARWVAGDVEPGETPAAAEAFTDDEGESASAAADLVLAACARAGVAPPGVLAVAGEGRGGGRRWRGFGRARALCLIVDDADRLPDATLAGLVRIASEAGAGPPGCCFLLVGSLLLGDRVRRLCAREQVAPIEIVLLPLPASEIEAYLHHRLAQAGASELRLFTFDAIAQIAAHTRGVPGQINHLCLTVLEHTRIGRGQRIGGVTIDEAAAVCRLGPQVMVDDTGAFHIVAVDSLDEPPSDGASDDVARAAHRAWPERGAEGAGPAAPPAAAPRSTCTDAEPVGIVPAEPVAEPRTIIAEATPAPTTAPAGAAAVAVRAGRRRSDGRRGSGGWLRPALAGAAAAVLAIDLGLILLYGHDGGRLGAVSARLSEAWSSLVGARTPSGGPARGGVDAATQFGGSSPPAPLTAGVDVDALVARGQKLFELGDHRAARLVLEHAAARGSAAAALLLARSYDPMVIGGTGGGVAPEPKAAADWYRRARELERRAAAAAAGGTGGHPEFRSSGAGRAAAGDEAAGDEAAGRSAARRPGA